MYDLEMLREVGLAKGSKTIHVISACDRSGDPPPCLFDYFPSDYLIIH